MKVSDVDGTTEDDDSQARPDCIDQLLSMIEDHDSRLTRLAKARVKSGTNSKLCPRSMQLVTLK